MKNLFLFSMALFLITACTKDENKEFAYTDYLSTESEIILVSPNLNEFRNKILQENHINTTLLPFSNEFKDQLQFLKYFDFKNETVLSLSHQVDENSVFRIITKKDSSLVSLDSIKNKVVETIREEEYTFKRFQLEENIFYITETENATVISNSRQELKDILANKNQINQDLFNKAMAASDPDKNSFIFPNTTKQRNQNPMVHLFSLEDTRIFDSWIVLDLDLDLNTLKFNGVRLPIEHSKSIFTGIAPKKIESGRVCPENFESLTAIGFDDFGQLFKNLSTISKDSLPSEYPGILDLSRELSIAKTKSTSHLIINVIEMEAAKEALAGFGELQGEFRNHSIYKTNQSRILPNRLNTLLKEENSSYYTFIDHFVIFSNGQEALESIISSHQNSNVLSSKTYYNELINSLSSESSLLSVSRIENKSKPNLLGAFQLIQEANFAHIHALIKAPENNNQSAREARQARSLKLDAPVAVGPFFFKNHRSDQLDIAVQDEKNTLYLISNKGTIFWKKDLDSRIQGDIYQVDLFKNGNQQLAFTTGFKLEVIDRTGKTVKPFPIKFNDPITQALSVFDYDNNRNYRFVLIQNKQVFMVGPKGKAIQGFDYEKATSDIIRSPKHIRLGNKDYILISEKSGKLNILSRQGNIRVPVSKTFNLGDDEWYGYKDMFITRSEDQKLIKIDQKGGVAISDSGLAENSRIVATDKHLVYLSENILSINDQKIELDFGLYTNPQIINTKSGTLISITDLQTQKVYVFNTKGDLLSGFPVYGNSQVDIKNADIDPNLELIVKGEKNEILIYEF